MMRTILTLQKTSYTEITRHPAYYILTLSFGVFILVSQKLVMFGFHSDLNMLREIGLATLIIWAVLACVLLSHQSIFVEIENRSALTVLTKPVFRHQYLFGKFLGLARSLFIGLLFLLLLLILTLWSYEGIPKLNIIISKASLHVYPFAQDSPAFESIDVSMSTLGSFASGCALSSASTTPGQIIWDYFFNSFCAHNVWPIIFGGFLTFLQSLILSSFAIALATFFPPVVVATGTISVYLIGHLTDLLSSAMSRSGTFSYIVGQLTRWVLPNLELFNPADHLSRGVSVSTIYIALATGYAILYVFVVLLTTAFAFSRRELP
jgi:hypothetical protein